MNKTLKSYSISFSLAALLLQAGSGLAADRDKCYRMHTRLLGVPPTEAALAACVDLVAKGQVQDAARAMMDNPIFYSDTLRYFFTPRSNEDGNFFFDFNDMVATAIGMVRDDIDWREYLSGDFQYTCEGNTTLPALANNNNLHYAACGKRTDIKDILVSKPQATINPALQGQPDLVPAGVYTTRAWAEAYYVAGTNRAATRYSLEHFLCEDIKEFHDTSIPDFRVRQDVDRIPGGASATWVNECKGCHAGMDGLTGAFAYFDWDEKNMTMVYSKPAPGAPPTEMSNAIARKFFVNSITFPGGYVTTNDDWVNLWTQGQNARVGWGVQDGTQIKGNGPKALGKMYANTTQYARCAAKQVYRQVCLQDLKLDDDKVKAMTQEFRQGGYKMKTLFGLAAAQCMGE